MIAIDVAKIGDEQIDQGFIQPVGKRYQGISRNVRKVLVTPVHRQAADDVQVRHMKRRRDTTRKIG